MRKAKRKITVCNAYEMTVRRAMDDLGLSYDISHGMPGRYVSEIVYFADRPTYYHLIEILDRENIIFSTSYL